MYYVCYFRNTIADHGNPRQFPQPFVDALMRGEADRLPGFKREGMGERLAMSTGPHPHKR